jgi:protein MpaA
MQFSIFGRSRGGLPILAYHFGQKSQGARILILGGVHGDEIEGIVAAFGLLEKFKTDFSLKLDLTIVPMFNVDGSLHRTRGNGAGVDLNRNLPTKDWSPEIATPRYHPGPAANSEPENHALVDFIAKEQPKFILSLHSYKPMLNFNGDSKIIAEEIAKHTGYDVVPSIGYPTPGALGTYGTERDIPVLTYEVERGMNEAKILSDHVPAILAGLALAQSHYTL